MDFLRRSWLFLKAKFGRTVLLIVIFSAILIFVLSGLIIKNAANVSIANAKDSSGASVSLAVNMEKVLKKSKENEGSFDSYVPGISQKIAQKIANLGNVTSFNFTYQTIASSDSLNQVSEGNNSSGSSQDGIFSICGTNNLKTNESFVGSSKIISGRPINDSDSGTNNVVIDSTLASQNHLKVGSAFKVTSPYNKNYKMNIVGIFKQKKNNQDNSSQQLQQMNTLYTALSVPNDILHKKDQISDANYNISNPGKVDEFVKKATKLIDGSVFQVSKSDKTYQNVKSALNNVSSFATNIVFLVSIAGAIILTLIVILMIRERRFEIGILTSLGESKIKIISQFFFELFIVMVVSVGLASTAGNFVGNTIGQQILKQETTQKTNSNENNNTQYSNLNGDAGGGLGALGLDKSLSESKNDEQKLNKLNIQTSFSEVLLLFAIALLIILIGVGIASSIILNMTPKEVLTN